MDDDANEHNQPKTDWECARCFWLLNGRHGDDIPEHAPQCPFRQGGRDPRLSDLEQITDGV
jgi:hypothetical protein